MDSTKNQPTPEQQVQTATELGKKVCELLDAAKHTMTNGMLIKTMAWVCAAVLNSAPKHLQATIFAQFCSMLADAMSIDIDKALAELELDPPKEPNSP